MKGIGMGPIGTLTTRLEYILALKGLEKVRRILGGNSNFAFFAFGVCLLFEGVVFVLSFFMCVNTT